MFFSVIIPIYNSQKSLENCLRSICNQSYGNYEVLMIDDGSKDRSGRICDEFAAKDTHFKVYHQENQGVSSARNNGLSKAKGDYICFIDSDDYVTSDYLEKLKGKIEKDRADVVFIGYHKVDQSGNVLGTYLPPTGFDGDDLLMKLSAMDMFGYTWIKCFSREILSDCCFPEAMSLFEDEVFACIVLDRAEKISVLPLPLYYYVIGGAGMLTGRTYEDYCGLSDKVFLAWEKLLEKTEANRLFLEYKANAFVERCKYYGFERNVDCKLFFESLAKTHFFRIHTRWSRLDRQIQTGNWLAVKAEIMRYKLKNRLYRKKR